MNDNYSAGNLAADVNRWCVQHGVAPASGQAGAQVSERNIRFYRTLGLVDPPANGAGSGYGEKHRLQLIAIRLLQAQGLPLNRIQQLLYGRSLDDLHQIERQGLAEIEGASLPAFRPAPFEGWMMTGLDDEFLLISRRGRAISDTARARILAVLGQNQNNPRRGRGARKED